MSVRIRLKLVRNLEWLKKKLLRLVDLLKKTTESLFRILKVGILLIIRIFAGIDLQRNTRFFLEHGCDLLKVLNCDTKGD
jgi:hypothetical protein